MSEAERTTPIPAHVPGLFTRFLVAITAAVLLISGATLSVWLLLDYPSAMLMLPGTLILAALASLLLAARGRYRLAGRLLFTLCLADVIVAHGFLGGNILIAALLSGGYLNLILLGGALFRRRGALWTTAVVAVTSTLLSLYHYLDGSPEALHLIPIYLTEFALSAGVLYYFISTHDLLNDNLQTAADSARGKTEELRNSEARFRRFIEAAPIAVFILDRTGRYTFVNPAAERLTGYARSELLQSRIPALSLPEQQERNAAAFEQLLQEESLSEETEIRTRSGRNISVLVQAVRLDSRQYMAFATDISERTRHEAELREAYRRTEEANKAKSEFLHTISHEVRTPLNTIIGMAHVLEQRLSSASVSSYLESIELSAYSLLGIFDEILDFARIESGDIEAGQCDFGLFELAEEALKPVILKAQERELTLRCNFDPRLPERVIGDYTHIKQILAHLLHNAVKFTEAGTVSFSMRAAEQSEEQCTVEFSVEDTGIGISPEQQAEIFELFRQADNSSTKHYGGIGLGLTLCKNLTELLQGSLSFSSVPERGSTFSFSLALDIPSQAEVPAPSERETEVILCIKDGEQHRQLSGLLEYYGARLKQSLAKEECTAVVEGELPPPDFDLCIVELDELFDGDVDTPLGTFLRSHRLPSGTIVALVPLFWEGVYRQVKETYALDDYILQPITPPKLRRVLQLHEG